MLNVTIIHELIFLSPYYSALADQTQARVDNDVDEDESEDEEEDDDEVLYNSCFAINNLYGLLLASFQLMITIVPYWADTDSAESSHLLSDVRIFKGKNQYIVLKYIQIFIFFRIFHRVSNSTFVAVAVSLSFIQWVRVHDRSGIISGTTTCTVLL